MIALVVGGWARIRGYLGRLSMYRLVLMALGILTLVALVLSFFELVVPSPLRARRHGRCARRRHGRGECASRSAS